MSGGQLQRLSDCVEKIDKSSVKDLSKYLNKINDIEWEKLKDTVLITGADGFIGSHLTESLRRIIRLRLCVYNSFNTWGWLDSIEKDLLEDVEVILGDVHDPNVNDSMKGIDGNSFSITDCNPTLLSFTLLLSKY